MAEVGLRSALEDAATLGARPSPDRAAGAAHGPGAPHTTRAVIDPEYRLERTYIKFLDQSRPVGAARDTWRGLAARHGDGHAFWLRYHAWEMRTWARLEGAAAASASAVGAAAAAEPSCPREATAVLRQAARRPNLDWPEKILETYMRHCEDHEDVVTLQAATRLVRRRAKEVARRREKEAAQAAEAAALAQAQQMQQLLQQPAEGAEAGEAMDDATMADGGAKRKREDAAPGEAGQAAKRTKTSRASAERTTAAEPARDREHTMVVVRNLPWNADEKRVRHFFHEVWTSFLPGKRNGIGGWLMLSCSAAPSSRCAWPSTAAAPRPRRRSSSRRRPTRWPRAPATAAPSRAARSASRAAPAPRSTSRITRPRRIRSIFTRCLPRCVSSPLASLVRCVHSLINFPTCRCSASLTFSPFHSRPASASQLPFSRPRPFRLLPAHASPVISLFATLSIFYLLRFTNAKLISSSTARSSKFASPPTPSTRGGASPTSSSAPRTRPRPPPPHSTVRPSPTMPS